MIKRIFIYIVMLLSIMNIYAITVDEILNTIANNNLSLQASNEKCKSLIYNIKSSNNLSDPEIGFEYHTGSNVDGNKYGISVTQNIDWPGLYTSRSKTNKFRISATESQLVFERLNILLEAKQLCIQIINLNKKIESQTLVFNNISQLYTEYEKGFQYGEISILDINKLKVELLNSKRVLEQLVAQRNANIKLLYGLNGKNEIKDVDKLSVYPSQSLESIETYLGQVLTLDPEVQTIEFNKKAAQNNISTAKMGWYPNFTIGYRYTDELGSKFNGVAVGVSVPIFSNKNKINEAKNDLISGEYNQQSAIALKESEIKANFEHIVTLQSQINSYKTILENDSNQLMLKKALDGGQITLLNYLLELKYFLEAKQTLLDLEYEYNTILTTLNKYKLL